MVSKCCCQEQSGCPFGELQDRGVREHIHKEHCVVKEYVLDLKDLTVFDGNAINDGESGRRMYFCMNTFAQATNEVGSIFILGTKSVGVPEDSLCCKNNGQNCVHSESSASCFALYGELGEYTHKSQTDETAFLRTPFSGLYNNKQWYYDNTFEGTPGSADTTRRPAFSPDVFAGATGIHPVLSAPLWEGFTGQHGSLRGRILKTHQTHTGSVKITEDKCELYNENDAWFKKIRLFVFMPSSKGCDDVCHDPCPFHVRLRCPSRSSCIDPSDLSIHCFSEGNIDLDPSKATHDFIVIDGVTYNTSDENYIFGNFGPGGVWLDAALASCPYQINGPDVEDGRCCAFGMCFDKNNIPWQISNPDSWGREACEDNLFGKWSQRGLCSVNPCKETCINGFGCPTGCYGPRGECVECGPPRCNFDLVGPAVEHGRCCVDVGSIIQCYDIYNPSPYGPITNKQECEFVEGRWSQTGNCVENPCRIPCSVTLTGCGDMCTGSNCTGVCNFPTAFSDSSCSFVVESDWVTNHHLRYTECEENNSVRKMICCPPCYKSCAGPKCPRLEYDIQGNPTPESLERAQYPCCSPSSDSECSCPPCTDDCGSGTLCCNKGSSFGTCPTDCPEASPWECVANDGKCPCPCPSCETDCDHLPDMGCCGHYNERTGHRCPCLCDECQDPSNPTNPYPCCGSTNYTTDEACPCVCDDCINLINNDGCCGSYNKTTGEECPCPPHPCESDCNHFPTDINGWPGVGCCGFGNCACLCDTCVVAPRWEGDPVSFLCCESEDMSGNACPCKCDSCEFVQGQGVHIDCCGWPGCPCECDSTCKIAQMDPWGCCTSQGGPAKGADTGCPCQCDNCEWVPNGPPSAMCCGYVNQYTGVPCPCWPPPPTGGSIL